MRYIIFLLISVTTFAKDYTIVVSKDVDRVMSKHIVYNTIQLNKELKETKFTFVDRFVNYKIFITYSPKPKGYIAGEALKRFFYCSITLYPPSINVFKTTLWHEIGHCTGLGHNGVHGHIMSEKVDPFENYSEDKVKEFIEDMKKVIE